MILGLDISTSITGATILDENGEVVYNEAWDTRKYKNIFEKAEFVNERISNLPIKPDKIYIEQSLQSFRSGFSSAKTLSTDVLIEYTKHGNPKPHCFDKADSWVVARAGWLDCHKKEK